MEILEALLQQEYYTHSRGGPYPQRELNGRWVIDHLQADMWREEAKHLHRSLRWPDLTAITQRELLRPGQATRVVIEMPKDYFQGAPFLEPRKVIPFIQWSIKERNYSTRSKSAQCGLQVLPADMMNQAVTEYPVLEKENAYYFLMTLLNLNPINTYALPDRFSLLRFYLASPSIEGAELIEIAAQMRARGIEIVDARLNRYTLNEARAIPKGDPRLDPRNQNHTLMGVALRVRKVASYREQSSLVGIDEVLEAPRMPRDSLDRIIGLNWKKRNIHDQRARREVHIGETQKVKMPRDIMGVLGYPVGQYVLRYAIESIVGTASHITSPVIDPYFGGNEKNGTPIRVEVEHSGLTLPTDYVYMTLHRA